MTTGNSESRAVKHKAAWNTFHDIWWVWALGLVYIAGIVAVNIVIDESASFWFLALCFYMGYATANHFLSALEQTTNCYHFNMMWLLHGDELIAALREEFDKLKNDDNKYDT